MLKRNKAPWAALAALAMAVVAAVALFVATPTTVLAIESSDVTVDKTATELTEDNKSTVTLSLVGETDKTYSDVVFVLDKSTSVDVKTAAKAMLSSLLTQAGDNKIKVGVVIFNKDDYVACGLTELTSDSYATIEAAIDTEMSSGTNLEAGLLAAQDMLESDTTVADSAKYVVLVTDGVSYIYDNNGTPNTIFTENDANGEECIVSGPWSVDEGGISDLMTLGTSINAASWLSEYGDTIKTSIDTYGVEYTASQYNHTGYDEDGNALYDITKYVPASKASTTANSNEAALYKAALAWQSLSSSYTTYAFGDTRSEAGYDTTYPWAAAFIGTLSSLGGSDDSSTTFDRSDTSFVAGMFDNVKSDILASIGVGSYVYDVMGADFDYVEGSAALTVDGEALAATTVDDVTYFGEADADGVYPYQLAYDSAADAITLTFNVSPLDSKVVLTYDVELVNIAEEAGTYTVPTNESAELYPSDGSDPVEFPVPEVSYTVDEEPEEVVVTPTPTVPTTTVKASSETIPETGDATSTAFVGLAIAALAILGVAAVIRKRANA